MTKLGAGEGQGGAGRCPRVPGRDPKRLRLTAAEGYLLSRIDGRTSWRLLREIGGIPAQDVDACLERWLADGLLEIVGGTAKRPPRSLRRRIPSRQADRLRPSDSGPRWMRRAHRRATTVPCGIDTQPPRSEARHRLRSAAPDPRVRALALAALPRAARRPGRRRRQGRQAGLFQALEGIPSRSLFPQADRALRTPPRSHLQEGARGPRDPLRPGPVSGRESAGSPCVPEAVDAA